MVLIQFFDDIEYSYDLDCNNFIKSFTNKN